MTGEIDPSVIGVFFLIMFLFILFVLMAYVYQALTLYYIARKTKTRNEWLAWIPIGNLVLIANIAKMQWWPVLLLIGVFIPIPFINILAMITLFVFITIWMWKICEARGKPGWWAILTLIPFFGSIWGLIMWGILAWGE